MTGADSCLNIRTPSKSLSLALPAGVTFEQGSCIPTPAGESCTDELHFRVRITVSKSTDPGKTAMENGQLDSCRLFRLRSSPRAEEVF